MQLRFRELNRDLAKWLLNRRSEFIGWVFPFLARLDRHSDLNCVTSQFEVTKVFQLLLSISNCLKCLD